MKIQILIRAMLTLRGALATAAEQCDMIIEMLQDELPKEEERPPKADSDHTKCEHPEGARQYIRTGGGAKPTWFCKACKHTSEELGLP